MIIFQTLTFQTFAWLKCAKSPLFLPRGQTITIQGYTSNLQRSDMRAKDSSEPQLLNDVAVSLDVSL